MHPAFPDIPIGGWAGFVQEVETERSGLYLVQWDRHTLEHLHTVYRARCQRDDCEVGVLWLADEDLEPDTGQPRVMEQPHALVPRPLRRGDADDRARAVFGLTSDDPLPPVNAESLAAYRRYLVAQLSFPFEAQPAFPSRLLTERSERGTVTRLLPVDECDASEGLWCEFHVHDETAEVPLALLDVRRGGTNRCLVEDYVNWFANASAGDDWTEPTAAARPEPSRAGSLVIRSGVYAGVYGTLLGASLAAEAAILGAACGALALGLLLPWLIAARGASLAVNEAPRTWSLLSYGIIGVVVGAMAGSLLPGIVAEPWAALAGGAVAALLGTVRVIPNPNWLGALAIIYSGAGLGALAMLAHRVSTSVLAGALCGGLVGTLGAPLLLLALLGAAACMAERQGK